jgi:hypothetical protein
MKRSIVALSILVVTARAGAATQNETWQRCGVAQNQTPQRVFADPDGKGDWKEYRTLQEVPQLANDSGEYAGLIAGNDGQVLIITQFPGEDFTAYTDYCFDKEGQVVQVRFELRTAWGWGYRNEGTIVKGNLSPRTSEFFDTKTENPIPKPGEDGDEILASVKPHIYLRKSQLPFSKLLPRKASN